MDSYVLESKIHFPTDLNLLYDSGRKCFDFVDFFRNNGVKLQGWRKRHYLRKQYRRFYRRSSEIHRKKGRNYEDRLKPSVIDYLEGASALSMKIQDSLVQLSVMVIEGELEISLYSGIESMKYYKEMLDKHIDLVRRRILLGEVIEHSEKLFSIFEPHVEWLSKGKMHKRVELGHNVVICTDQYQFILDYEVMMQQSDPAMGMLLGQRIIKNYKANNHLYSISFDRGFYSSTVKETLSKEIEHVIMPKPGKKSLKLEAQEREEIFVGLRKKHSAVEANINQLEHHGLNKCPDKGENGFKRYVGLGILAYNLHHLGKLLLQEQEVELKKIKRLKQAG